MINATAPAVRQSVENRHADRSSATILAFDFGQKFIGVAVGDAVMRIANPLGLVSGAGNAARFRKIDALIGEWEPGRLVVGLPLAMDGSEHAMTARARRFARQLAARYRVPVEFADERLSSAAAAETLSRSGRGGRDNKDQVHAEAARVILQGYLDEHGAA